MNPIYEKSYGELFEQAGRWRVEVTDQLKERSMQMGQIESYVRHAVDRFINGQKVRDVESEVLDGLLQQQARRLWATEANALDIAARVNAILKETWEQFERPLLSSREESSLYDMGYTLEHITLAQTALSCAKDLLAVAMSNLAGYVREFQEHHDRVIASLNHGWNSLQSPGWIWPSPAPPAWLQEVEQKIAASPPAAEDLNIKLSSEPSPLVERLSSQSILLQLPSLDQSLPLSMDWPRNLAVLLAIKPYPREEEGLASDDRSVDSEMILGSMWEEEEVETDPPRDPNSVFASITPLFLSLATSISRCSAEKTHILSTFDDVEEMLQLLPEAQMAFIDAINLWNQEILSSPPERGEIIRGMQKKFAIDNYVEKLDDALQRFQKLRETRGVLLACLEASREAFFVGMRCNVTDVAVITLKKLRFPTQPIRECRKSINRCMENIEEFKRYLSQAEMLEQQSQPILDRSLRDLKWSREELSTYEVWTYPLGFRYSYLEEELKTRSSDPDPSVLEGFSEL